MLKACGADSEDKWFDNSKDWKMGEGKQTMFWLDEWTGQECLVVLYPRLFLISKQKHDTVHKMGQWEDDTWVWKFRWRRERFVWEEDQILTLLQILNTFSMKKLKDDSWNWKPEPSGELSVSSAYKTLMSQTSTNGRQELFACMWKLDIPPKVFMFVWRLFTNL
uniref:Reverse transcriptase zinc-binding domain-containing protein n=1 Tax=Cajanus cajan TaxID=3821 RepID=A0A151RX09_CAJCA|nr:hypothetical protein KK1_031349 [Cajanus cajan]